MTYIVRLTKKAEAEYQAAYDWLAEKTPLHAPIWYNALRDALLSLKENPARFPKPNGDLHQLLFGDKHHAYRLSFKIKGDTVMVYSIRHAARKN